ncbi:hypothetical protein KR018_006828, partial [Drosophila ironensis]
IKNIVVYVASNVQRCRYGNESCMVESLNDYIKTFAKGYPELGLRPFDKLHLPDLTVFNTSHDLPIWLTFILRQRVLRGLENSTVISMKGFERDPTKKKMLIKLKIPRLENTAIFEFETKILLCRCGGRGHYISDLQNVTLTIEFHVYVEYRKKKRHIMVYDLGIQVELDRWILSIDNLYDSNTDLSIAMNRVLNENWLEFWNELEPGFIPSINHAGADLLHRFFHKYSYDDMFLD